MSKEPGLLTSEGGNDILKDIISKAKMTAAQAKATAM